MYKKVADIDGSIFDVKELKDGSIMLCGEWLCLQMTSQAFSQAIINGSFEVV